MSNQPVFWKMRNGKLVSVDEMDANHIKNAFKHLIKHHQNVVQHGSAPFNLNGNIDQSFNNDMELWDMEMEAGITDIETGLL
jgi:hypothetical protein